MNVAVVCSPIDLRRRQNVIQTSVAHSSAPFVPLLRSHHILTLVVTSVQILLTVILLNHSLISRE